MKNTNNGIKPAIFNFSTTEHILYKEQKERDSIKLSLSFDIKIGLTFIYGLFVIIKLQHILALHQQFIFVFRAYDHILELAGSCSCRDQSAGDHVLLQA